MGKQLWWSSSSSCSARASSSSFCRKQAMENDEHKQLQQHSPEISLSPAPDRDANLLLPGLPNELALLCLARLPFRIRARCCCVSPAWRRNLQSSSFDDIRNELGIREDWVLLRLNSLEEGDKWLLWDPLCLHGDVLPPPKRDEEIVLRRGDVVYADMCGSYLKCGRGEVLRFDVVGRRWCIGPLFMGDRNLFAWATLDGFLYVGGGVGVDGNGRLGDVAILKSAERLNLKTLQWEMLPDMIEGRYFLNSTRGFVMAGCFYAMGGGGRNSESKESGEFFNPRTGVWTLVPKMCPKDLFGSSTWEPPHVAVVNDQLYALSFNSTAIWWYDKQKNRWFPSAHWERIIAGLGDDDPIRAHRGRHGIITRVGDELWIILAGSTKRPISILSCKPDEAGRLLTWRTLPFNFTEQLGNIIGCVVFKV